LDEMDILSFHMPGFGEALGDNTEFLGAFTGAKAITLPAPTKSTKPEQQEDAADRARKSKASLAKMKQMIQPINKAIHDQLDYGQTAGGVRYSKNKLLGKIHDALSEAKECGLDPNSVRSQPTGKKK
jgi:hypothetical protein